MKKISFRTFFVAVLFLGGITLAAPAYAQVNQGLNATPSTPSSSGTSQTSTAAPSGGSAQFVPIAPIPGLTQGTVANSQGLANFLNNLYRYLIGLAAILAIIEIIWGGLEISTKDSVSKHSDGKERITQAILGLVLILLPYLVFTLINPSILNLSINVPPLDTTSVPTPSNPGSSCTYPSCTKDSDCPVVKSARGPSMTYVCAGVTSGSCGTCTPAGPTGAQKTPTTEYACKGSDCSAATTQCESAQPANAVSVSEPVECQKSNGTIDVNGRTDSSFLPTWVSGYACVTGESLVVSCSYTVSP